MYLFMHIHLDACKYKQIHASTNKYINILKSSQHREELQVVPTQHKCCNKSKISQHLEELGVVPNPSTDATYLPIYSFV